MVNANDQAIGQNEEDQQVGHDPSNPSVPIKVGKRKIEGLDAARIDNVYSTSLAHYLQ
jgi:hypothetical protein